MIHTVKGFSIVNKAEINLSVLARDCPSVLLSGSSLPSPGEKIPNTGKVVWYSHLFRNFPQFVVIHTVKGFSVVNEAEVYAFLEFTGFFCDPSDVGNLISGSSAFSKSSFYIWKFPTDVLLKPSSKDFVHNLASV